ncbi:MAG: alpha-2,8-polysialyltransferase family protein, partial [Rickettsiales bacterium]|nr:alpha-2,8-polysialyltransferase family protein [Rickettsiales bacterium]
MRQLLDEIGVTFVNLWFAPYKLFEDEFFILNTNDESIFYKLINYKTPEEHFYYYGNYYKAFIKNRLGFRDDFLCDNSVLFVGQCMTDISVLKDGVFLNITHFKEKISNLLSQYSKIYYIDHPFCKNVAHIDKYINQTKNIEKLEQIPTYYLLSSDKIKKVVGISSSILDEAKYFEKDVEFFFESIFQFNCKFGINNFINIYNKYY